MTAPAPLDLTALLDDLERAHAAATPGPWSSQSNRVYGRGYRVATVVPGGEPGAPEADAAAIVALHNAFPTLAAELRKRDAALCEFATLADSYPLGTDVPVYRLHRILAALSPESVQS